MTNCLPANVILWPRFQVISIKVIGHVVNLNEGLKADSKITGDCMGIIKLYNRKTKRFFIIYK